MELLGAHKKDHAERAQAIMPAPIPAVTPFALANIRRDPHRTRYGEVMGGSSPKSNPYDKIRATRLSAWSFAKGDQRAQVFVNRGDRDRPEVTAVKASRIERRGNPNLAGGNLVVT